MPEEKFDKKWLAGLKFRDSKAKKIEKDGRRVTTYEPFERAMKEEDVLSWKDEGATVTLVTADGQKVTVKK